MSMEQISMPRFVNMKKYVFIQFFHIRNCMKFFYKALSSIVWNCITCYFCQSGGFVKQECFLICVSQCMYFFLGRIEKNGFAVSGWVIVLNLLASSIETVFLWNKNMSPLIEVGWLNCCFNHDFSNQDFLESKNCTNIFNKSAFSVH